MKRTETKKIFLFIVAAIACALVLCATLVCAPSHQKRAYAEPEQTYDIHSAEEFIAYSRAYASGERNPKDVLNISINTGNVVTTAGFVSLGTAARPFAGTLIIPTAGVDTFHLFNCPLFDYVTTDLVISGVGNVKIVREAAPETPASGTLTTGALFANHVVRGTNAANWRVTLSPYSGEGTEAASFDSVLGEVAENCSITLSFTNTSDLAVASSGNAGLLCGTLGAGATLVGSVAGSGSDISVTSSSASAGGLVGSMGVGSTLQLASDNLSRVTSVTAKTYAGGLVGTVNEATVSFAAGVSDYMVDGTVSGGTAAGGLFGYYKKTGPATLDMADYHITNDMTITGSGHSGGVIGLLENGGGTFTFDGNSGTETIQVSVSGGNRKGGVFGAYKASALTDTLSISDVSMRLTASSASVSGGLIGETITTAAYVDISNVTVTCVGDPDGGLVGSVGAVGSFIDLSGTITVSGTAHAGLVGEMKDGVLRLSGVTNLGSYTRADASSGFLVKDRDRALIYATGDGKGVNGNWTFKRNLSTLIDDVHSWGEVLRADGTILAASNLFAVDGTAHTVTIQAASTSIGTITQFALTALNIQLNTKAAVGALRFTSGSANESTTLLGGTLTLTADLSLAGTGLTGLTRDDGQNAAFSGTFNGGDHTLTLAIGENYGLDASGNALAAGSDQGNIFTHTHTGLFAKIASSATVKDLVLSGSVTISQNNNDGMYAGGVAAEATGTVIFTDLTTSFTFTYKTLANYSFNFGSAVGRITGAATVSATDCTFSPTVTDRTESSVGRGNVSWIGGFVGAVVGTSSTQSITIEDSDLSFTYTKTINSNRESAFGAAIAYIGNTSYVKDRRKVSIDNVSVDLSVTGKAAGNCFGGILGTEWYATDVTIDSLTVNSATVAVSGSRADIGGLTQIATGMWNVLSVEVVAASYSIPNNGSTFGFVANKSYVSSDAQSNALYVEIDDANYDIGALSFSGTPNFTYFDEIVASSVAAGANVTDNGNSIVSITTSSHVIDTSGSAYNTYLNKTAYGRSASGKINPYTRYYYDIAYARTNVATAKFGLLIWSVSQYAHSSLSAWFTSGTIFTGLLDMTGLSYYPVDLGAEKTLTLDSVTLVLDNVLMEPSVNYSYRYTDGSLQSDTSRSTRTSGNQHYLMHTALLRNVAGTLTVDTATLQGNVPKLSDSLSGFLVAGTVGNNDGSRAKCALTDVTFDGVYISSGNNHFTDTTYAPLAMNKVGKNSTVDWRGGTQNSYSSFASNGWFAGSSLIGDVGSTTARAVYLSFEGMAFDSRTSATSIDNLDTCYGTTKAIFSRSTFLNSLRYFAESSCSYKFEAAEDRTSAVSATHAVTYGKEITSSTEYAGKEEKYYDSEHYVHPTAYQSASAYDFSTGFLPYVYVASDLGEYKHEIAVNITFSGVIEGCGKYGDPFIIDSDTKLPIISQIIAGTDVGSVQIYLPSDLTSYNYTSTSYTKYLYTFGVSTFTSSNGGTSRNTTDVRRYLAGAYYVISKDIVLPNDYVALGYVDTEMANPEMYAFRGVLIGSGNPTIKNQSRNPIIQTSNGSVIKGLTVDVDVNYNSTDTIELAAPLGSDVYAYSGGIQSYGAVIGQILGGDTFIDNVQVVFSNVTFSVTVANASNNFPRLTPIGGYVGVIVNGGLIFRNMTAANVGLTSSTYDKIADEGYLYVNPIIGRVIAGYAFYESATYHATEDDCTLKNGLKNYTIADLSLSESKLNVTYADDTAIYSVTVPNGQALFVLSAIVNSGAASASYHASNVNGYQGLTEFWSAYRSHTTARAGATYDAVGASGFSSDSDYTDYAVNDKYSDNAQKIPYIVRAYTTKSGSAYLARCICSTANVNVSVTGDCDVPAGFRGIGSIYYDSTYLRLRVTSFSGKKGEQEASYQINLNMRYLEYNHLKVSKYIGVAQANTNSIAGLGLFNRLDINSASSSNSVQYLVLTGSIFYDVYKVTGAGGQANYNYSAFKDNDRSEVKDLKTDDARNTEDATMRRTILSVGGIAGFVNNSCYIKNVTFDDFSVEGAKYAGGLIGLVYTGVTSDTKRCTITYDANITNAGYVNVVGGQCAGGLVGKIYMSIVEITGASGGTDLIIKTIESKDTDPDESGLVYFANMNTGVGGVIGNCWGSDKTGYAYPSILEGVSFSNKAQNELIITNINVVRGNTAATVRVRNDRAGDEDDRYNYAGGFVGSAHYVYLKLNNCNVGCVNVSANSAGGFIGKMTQHYYLEVFNCSINGCLSGSGTTKDAAITGTRHAGGMVGWVVGRDKIYFQLLNFTIKNYLVESYSRKNTVIAGAGGIVGYAEGNNVSVSAANNVICQFNNLTVLNCDVKSNYTNKTDNYLKYKCGTGGIIGVIDTLDNSDGKGDPVESNRSSNSSNKYKFSGYNILVKDCTFTHLNGGTDDDSTSATNRRIGDIVGNNAVSTTIKFVGVSVQNNTYCGKHVGFCDGAGDNYGSDGTFGTGYLVLANYSGVTAGTVFAEIEDDSTDADNYTDVTVAAPFVTANPALNIVGMTLTGDGVATSVNSLPIQNIISDGASGRYGYAVSAYYTGSSGDNNLTAFTSFGNKFTMFSSEVSGYLGVDFPVLIVDDTSKVNSHKLINSYLRLLTNTTHDFGTDSANVYSVYVYNVIYEDDLFSAKATGASLRRADGQFYITNTSFDSGKEQFSLIDVRFLNPVDSTVAYHLYVPVFVKKVLSYSFDIAAQSGTTYLEEMYEDKFGQALIENVGTPVMLYFRYTYTRSASEWTEAINAGENVQRNYGKQLLFYKANTNEQLKNFPAGTVLVLVDPNRGGKPYYATVGTAISGNTLSLSAFRETMTKENGEYVFSGDTFSPCDLGDMLSLTVSTVGGGADRMVACATNDATVVVDGQGYRLATDEELADGEVVKYTVTAAVSDLTESYYLSVFTESNATNDLLFHYYLITTPTAFSESTYPSKIFDTGAHTMVHLVMGKIFHHADLTVDSSSKLGPEVMTSDNNELTVDFTAELGLSNELDEEIKSNIASLIRTANVYHSFLVYLNRNDGYSVKKAVIGDPTGTGSYLLDGIAGAVTTNYAAANIRVTQNYAEFVTGNLNTAFATGGSFTIRASVTLAYGNAALLTQFPGRGTTTPDNGVTVSGSSNLAFSLSTTTYSKNSISLDETPPVTYYSEAEPEVATLSLNAIGDSLGDFTPLGINAKDNNNATSAEFDLLAVLDISLIAEVVAGYEEVGLSVRLAAKNGLGEYEDVEDITDYMTLSIDNVNGENITSSGALTTVILDATHPDMEDNGADITLPELRFSVLTGNALESAGLPYTNYRITVTVWLIDDQDVDFAVSRANNYVVYTNAKVIPDYVE